MKAKDDKSVENSKKPKGKPILYLGEDEGYWQDIKDGLLKFKQLDLNFSMHWNKDPGVLQSFIYLVYSKKPKVVFIDLEKSTHEMMHVLRAVLRTNSVVKPFVVALTHYTQDKSVLRQAIMAGAKCVHVKSSEMDSLLYDVICFAFHNALDDHGFATAKMEDRIEAHFPAKVSMVTPKGILVESNIELKEKEKYTLRNYWSETGILKSAKAKLGIQKQENLFYKFEYAQSLGFEYIDPIKVTDDSDPEQVKQMEMQREELLAQTIEAMEKSLDKLRPSSSPKLIKTLVVDKEMVLYRDRPLTDSYPFLVRVQPYIIEVKKELKKLRPHMIAYHFERVNAQEFESNQDLAFMFNESRNLAHIIKTIKTIEEYNPFIVVFGAEHGTEELQKAFNYKQIIGYREALGPQLLVQMGHILMKRLGDSIQLPENAIVIDKNNTQLSYAQFSLELSLIACSENDVYFNSDFELQEGDVFCISSPAPMYLTVAPMPPRAKAQSQYYAIVHGVTDGDKKDLRRFVNSVFFREKEQAKIKDKEEQELAKKKYLEEQQKSQQDQSQEE